MKSQRAELVADTAIGLLVERGMRGLTHRAVDEVAGLPAGSTSNLARTRSALLELALARLTQLEAAAFQPILDIARPGDLDALAEMAAQVLHLQLTVGRRHTIARYELALEATRRPELRRIYDRSGERFREPAVAILSAAGSSDPVRHARQVVAFCEGVMFDAGVGAGVEPTLDDLRLGVREFLRGMLGGESP
ncbi:DNA-binding transcriptional regulator YbjK [Streptosporangium becharense]|uniref:DNA-binding transcriptional regulator YbjK n=1 Tax=Streptosporangium becharense TaxID=1816182 RepID=A0A7W9IJ64_9ACTN|nr:TetR family transcriptional regulator C-terminal domain-containing protein [Streptosporangium becharense]MBB2911208.1 DNA-binding transcriptional regulator YbjK [Streptosporangium becharense]MBB5821734.1 DNA-binding transcriptional regulator YbjK [Streptosporangium becharense]